MWFQKDGFALIQDKDLAQEIKKKKDRKPPNKYEDIPPTFKVQPVSHCKDALEPQYRNSNYMISLVKNLRKSINETPRYHDLKPVLPPSPKPKSVLKLRQPQKIDFSKSLNPTGNNR